MEAWTKISHISIAGTRAHSTLPHKESDRRQISGLPRGHCPCLLPHWKDFPVPPQSPHSCLRKKAQLPDRVITDVQALSHPVAAVCYSHGHVPDLADENQTYPLPLGFFFFPTAAAVTVKCQLSPKHESKYCDSPTSSTNGRGHWWRWLSFLVWCLFINHNSSY